MAMWLIDPKRPQYKANLHSHSTLSDGRLTDKELVAAYKERGYDILAITDHEYPCAHNELSTRDFLLLTGYEAYIRPSKLCRFDRFKPEIHMNLIAKDKNNTTIVAYDPFYCKYMPLPKAITAPHYGNIGPRKFTWMYINKFIEAASECGYLVSLNHPCWSMQPTKDLIKLRGFWSMEIFNTSSMKTSGYAENMPVYDMLMRNGRMMYCHGADDNHNKRPLEDPMSDSFGAWTMIQADKLEYETVIDSLSKGNMYASTGPTIKALGVKDDKIILECSNARFIRMHMTPKYAKTVYDKQGGTVNKARFNIPEDAKYVYFSVTDEKGGKAYTHPYPLDELA